MRTAAQRAAVIAAEQGPVKYIGRVPATLKNWCEKNVTKVREVAVGGGYDSDNSRGYSYDIFLRRGWSAYGDCVHTVIESNVPNALVQLRALTPCECDYCTGKED